VTLIKIFGLVGRYVTDNYLLKAGHEGMKVDKEVLIVHLLE
jgi:hypothetical protein